MTGCAGQNAKGEPCGAPPSTVDETGFCPAHRPGGRERLREASKKGGAATARKLKQRGLAEDELPPLKTPQDAEAWLEIVGRAVAGGRLGHHEGRAVIAGIREWLKAFDQGSQAERLEKLERRLREARLEVVK